MRLHGPASSFYAARQILGHVRPCRDPGARIARGRAYGPTPFIGRLKGALARGVANRTYVHPYAVNEQEARESIALTYGMISMVDDGIGRILAKLNGLGLAENTIVIYSSDHGDIMGDHGIMLKHGLHTEGVIRMPMIWADPEAQAGQRSDMLASAIDFMPSVLARAGLQPFTGVQGVDVVGLVQEGRQPDRTGVIIEADRAAGECGCGGLF